MNAAQVRRRRRFGVVLVVSLIGVPALPAMSATPPDELLVRPAHGHEAVRVLGEDLDDVAALNRMRPSELRSTLRSDPTLWVDTTGRAFFKEPTSADASATSEPAAAAAFPNSQTFALHTDPGAQRTIYLDFDGHTVSGTAWNSAVPSFPSRPFDLDGSPTTWSQAEHDYIQSVWQRVAEDFAPFRVDVTTEDPGAAALDRSSSTDQVFGTRVLISPSPEASAALCNDTCGGIAYLGTFPTANSSFHQPAWVFPNLLTGVKAISEAASHEAGHNLGLSHDGTPFSNQYSGFGNWSPIMGIGYSHPVVQWSKGEYDGANNTEDDLAVIQSNGLPLRSDEYGDTMATATAMGGASSWTGVLTHRTDVDMFAISRSCGGSTVVSVDPAPTSPNADIDLQLLSSSGQVLAQNNPVSATADYDKASGMSAAVTTSLASGTYYLRVDGSGALTPSTGYSDYASLGRYTVTVSGCASSAVPSVPTSVVATPVSSTSATLSWQPPADPGSSPITGYVVSRDGGTGGGAGWSTTVGSTSRSLTLNGLQLGATYTLSVAAVNATGKGSDGIASVTVGTPGLATNVVGKVGSATSATLTWSPPATPGAAQITGYRVTRDGGLGGGSSWSTVVSASTRSLTFNRLVTGDSYSLSVAAINSHGTGPTVTRVVRVATAPSAPLIGTAAAGGSGSPVTATARWGPPSSDGGSPITGYRVRALEMSPSGTVLRTTTSALLPSTARTLSMTLPRSGNYRFTVQAVNAIGAGGQSARSNLVAGR